MRLRKDCPICGKKLELVKKWELVSQASLMEEYVGHPPNLEVINFYKCGHMFVKIPLKHDTSGYVYTSLNQRNKAYDFQIDGVKFAAETDFNCLIADEMGLGKTVQALLTLKNAKETLCPALIIVKGATTWQWLKKYQEWCNSLPLSVYMCNGGSKQFIPPAFDSYIISMDTFSRMVKVDVNPYNGKVRTVSIDPNLKRLGIKSVIVDECQSFKNMESLRSRALVGFLQFGGPNESSIEHKIFLSGTPIKNRAEEYFVTLNLLKPEEFPSIERFRRDWLEQDTDPVTFQKKNKWSRVKEHLLGRFREVISDVVIRREQKDVQPDLPPFRRTFEVVNIENEELKRLYNAEVAKMQDIVDKKAKEGKEVTYMDVSDNLMTMRRITGMAKVPFTIEYIDTFLDTTENEKIAIGIHHQGVRDLLYDTLKSRGINVLKISGEDNPERKEKIKLEFQKPENRVLIISMLAGGVGMDGLQVCNNVVGLERQWNSVDEEQFEKRFHRDGQTRSVLCEYFIARGTSDEWLSNMVEEKRFTFGQTVSNDWDAINDPTLFRDLIDQTLRNKLQ